MEILLPIVFFVLGGAVVWIIALRKIAIERGFSTEKFALEQDAIRMQADEIRKEKEAEIVEIRRRGQDEMEQLRQLSQSEQRESYMLISSLKEHCAGLQTKLDGYEGSEKIMRESFENIAAKILEDKSGKFAEYNTKQIKEILDPLSKDIANFKSKIEQGYLGDTEHRGKLSAELKQLMELNKRLSEDAVSLTKALKGEQNPKFQGDWGEMILDSVLTNSGLTEGQHYFTQHSSRNDDGQLLRPDVIVRYPDGREIVIDAKVSLTAYSRYVSAATQAEREQALAEHILSVKRHIDTLSAKSYDSREASLDFVMMFMPIEPAYMLALSGDTALWEYAYKKKIVLVSPTHLITALKLVYDLWSRYAQSQNALKIASRGAELYDKFVGFVNDMLLIGKGIDNSKKQYDQALSKLSQGKGNLVRQAEMLRELGVRSGKEIAVSSEKEEDEN